MKTKSHRRHNGPLASVRAWAGTLHRDTRGAVSILVLLTIWCLVALLGMVWNTAEEARRRAQVQTAADAAAHAAGTWMARMGNTITAQNMIICQDASTEAIWAALTPTADQIDKRLTEEMDTINRMRQEPGLKGYVAPLSGVLMIMGEDYRLTASALDALEQSAGANYANAEEARKYANEFRQARSALDWVQNTYLNGQKAVQPDDAPARPGPPGPAGQGLVQLVDNWKPKVDEDQILDFIENFINTNERPKYQAFVNRTGDMATDTVGKQMALHEHEVYQNEVAMLQAFSESVERQRTQLADQYGVEITLATMKNGRSLVESEYSGTATVVAPYMPAFRARKWPKRLDLIRHAYPEETWAAGFDELVEIDAINPHTGRDMIWHPGVTVNTPAEVRAIYLSLAPKYHIDGNFPEGWGHLWTMPLERYFLQRVSADGRGILLENMLPLDEARSITLAEELRRMMGTGEGAKIADLPATIADDHRNGPVRGPAGYEEIAVLPHIKAPPNAGSGFRTDMDLYNKYASKYTNDARQVRAMLQNYLQYFEQFTTPFADHTWRRNLYAAGRPVLERLGEEKLFTVLSTYRLRLIPDWARAGMFQGVVERVEDTIVMIQMPIFQKKILDNLAQADPKGLGMNILDPKIKQAVLYAAYAPDAAWVAERIVRPAAHVIAQEVAAEWVSRPWPYEITPPDRPVPPFRGVRPDERKVEFSVLAAARETDATSPRLALRSIFGTDQTKIVPYAQGEMFNWQEFNPIYGAQRYDETILQPEILYDMSNSSLVNFIGVPRGWRVASRGGWEWRGRLSHADMLYDVLQNNPDLVDYLQDAGISHPSGGALDAINLH